MYGLDDLFDKRDVVGIRLKQLITERGFTKLELSEYIGVSRPTLNKILEGTLTNKANFEKYMSKIMSFFSISLDMLLGNIQNQYIRAKKIRSMIKMRTQEISKVTGIPLARLMEIEAGEDATISELRDVALLLTVSVRSLLGKDFFEPQIATYDLWVRANEADRELYSGFWGHLGVQSRNGNEFLWFPITRNTRMLIYRMMKCKRIVVPCMNNKVLLLNMQNINEIVLLDDDCDQPEYINWNYEVDCANAPLVIYEALEDYCYSGEKEQLMSPGFCKAVERLIAQNGWSEEEAFEEANLSRVYYTDGTIRPLSIDFTQIESISDEIETLYLFEDAEYGEDIFQCVDGGGAEVLLNMRNIALLELPLLSVEDAICAKTEEWTDHDNQDIEDNELS